MPIRLLLHKSHFSLFSFPRPCFPLDFLHRTDRADEPAQVEKVLWGQMAEEEEDEAVADQPEAEGESVKLGSS